MTVTGGKCVDPACGAAKTDHIHYQPGPLTLAEVVAERAELRAELARERAWAERIRQQLLDVIEGRL